MTGPVQVGTADLWHGDCREVLKLLPEASVDAIVTDPPYELGFMGKAWDSTGIAYDIEVWRQCLRVLKPGGHLLAFGGTRTQHRMVCAIEDAGFQVRDQIAWIYGSGFPKSLDVSKAIDREAGAVRERIGPGINHERKSRHHAKAAGKEDGATYFSAPDGPSITAPATPAAAQWQGWGTALKPALEPICLARKPLAKGCTVAANVLAHGTGAINIDGCRVAAGDGNPSIARQEAAEKTGKAGGCLRSALNSRDGLPACNKDIERYTAARPGELLGRWPANLIHDGSDEVLAVFPDAPSGSIAPYETTGVAGYNGGWRNGRTLTRPASEGSAARFFYCSKASRSDRDEGLQSLPMRVQGVWGDLSAGKKAVLPRANHHPTVKPTSLMRYLVRLVTPPGGLVLDPFMGSGSTGKAAALERMRFAGIDADAAHFDLARRRLAGLFDHG